MKKVLFSAALVLVSFLGQHLFAQGIKAEMFALEAAKRMMRAISPNTGNAPSAYLYNWDYDANERRYTIKMSANWYARKCYLCDGEARFEVVGYLEVNRDGTRPEFTEISRNQAVKDAWTNQGVAGVVAAGAIVAVAASERN